MDQAARNPQNTIHGPKKLIGLTYEQLFAGSKRYPFTVLHEQPVPMIRVSCPLFYPASITTIAAVALNIVKPDVQVYVKN